ncbi:hypothetical protein EGN72_18135 [Pseudorhodobacter sp. E13]|uniref:hypothetical protein n=1 Tax=Pseudorhodobacter sp. E13 TaxID=2487931 RepID=UPI000F8EEEA9|nr:hypothetical protein [Pseudorhodobacter sp. E13]RUS58840.1 hypothetical protein EGN72_18135 [Pseudorhodobacter sp. E13]
MTYLIVAAIVILAFLYVAFVIVPFVTRPASLFSRGPAHARMKGIFLIGFTAVALLFIVNPDHLTEIKSRFWESLALAGFSAVFWLPVYLVLFSRRAESVMATKPKDMP